MTTDALALPALARPSFGGRVAFRSVPVVVVLAALIVGWYALAVWLNGAQVSGRFARDNIVPTTAQYLDATWSMERPVLPAPHQVAKDFYTTVFATPLDSKRSLVYHAGVTVSATLVGFILGAVLGIALHKGWLEGETAFDLSRLDEAFQEEKWGVDAEAAERTARLRGEAAMLERWFRALAA